MKYLQHASWLFTIILALAACATPQTFNEGVASGLGTVTAARNLAGNLLDAKKITADDAENVQKQADNTREGILLARTIHIKDPIAGQAKLDAQQAMIRALQAYLATRQVK